MRKMKVSMFNMWADEEATVDIEDMPLGIAKDLVEALTIIRATTGQFYPDLADLRDRLREALSE